MLPLLKPFFVTMSVAASSIAANKFPPVVRIGGVFPILVPGSTTIDPVGIQYLAAFLMAIKEINNKHDGYYDDLLPFTQLEFAVRYSKGDFIDDVYGAIDLATNAFNGTGVQGTVGAATNKASSDIAQIFNGFKLNQVAYGSTGSFLSYVAPYPYFFRTCSDDAYQGYAIADIIHKHFNWNTVSLFSSTDSYGSDLFQQFYIHAVKLGISIVSIHQFRSGLADFSPQIKDAKSRGTRVFVLFMAGTDAGKLLEQGYNAGLFRADTQIIGSDQVVSAAAWSKMSSSARVQDILRGALSVSQSSAYDTNSMLSFARRWVQQNDTVTINTDTGLETCHAGKDDDGGTDLYQVKVKSESEGMITKCAGLRFKSQFKADGTGIADYAPFAYDATLALATGLHKTIYEQGYSKFDGDLLNAAMTYNFSLSGATGDIAFRIGDSTGYGFGDREVGIKFTINNFQPNLYCPLSQSGGLASIGTWDSVHSFRPCASCKPVYNTMNNLPPLDKPGPFVATMSGAERVLMIVLGVICSLLIAILAAILFSYRKKKLVKASQPLMLAIAMFGGLLSCARIFAAAPAVSTTTCILFDWCGHLSFAFVFGSLLIKTWRVHLIVNASMRRIKITTEQVLLITLGIIFATMVYLIILTVVGQPHLAYTVQDLGLLQTELHPRCDYKLSGFATALYVIEALALLQGVRLCWLTKDVPDAVNDSKNIAVAMYVIAFISAIVFPIIFLLPIFPEVQLLISSVGFAIATLSSMCANFVPKIYLLIIGAELDSKLGIVMPNRKKADGKGVVAAAEVLEDAAPLYASQAETKLRLTKHSREEDIQIARSQILKWQKVLLQIENRGMISSGSGSSSGASGSRAPSERINNPSERSLFIAPMEEQDEVEEDPHDSQPGGAEDGTTSFRNLND